MQFTSCHNAIMVVTGRGHCSILLYITSAKTKTKPKFNFKIFTKFEGIDTEIDNFCDLSDFILSRNLCDKN